MVKLEQAYKRLERELERLRKELEDTRRELEKWHSASWIAPKRNRKEN